MILPLQPVFSYGDPKELEKKYKISFTSSQKVISLPFHPWLKQKEVDVIVKNIFETL